MNQLRLAFSGLAVLALGVSAAYGQSVISARSGLIHYVEGRVLLDGKPVEVKIATFPEVKENMELRSEDGRAEVLLNPGAFLRLGENSAVRMVSDKLSDSRIEFVSGSMVIEADNGEEKGADIVTVLYHNASVRLRKGGIYRFDSEPAQVRVYSGEVEVANGTNTLVAKGGKLVALDTNVSVEKFDSKDNDALGRWSRRRAEYISMANMSAAKSVLDSGNTWRQSGWYYNPYFAMMTYLPGGGVYRSPYGYMFYAPTSVYRVYDAPVYARSMPNASSLAGPNYQSMQQNSSGYSGVMTSAPVSARASAPSSSPAPAAAAPSAPVARESGRVGGGR